ncbi:MAG TPA: ATP-binding protein [Opitutaceae bacterium]|jgi:anti-sigma regulatory factor (Ser/Thr protein kinase)|nr:ATP-binding protein [Opitutaceae bacterium]
MAPSTSERADPITLRLAFAPKPEGARAVSIAVRTFLADNGVDERELFSFELCVAEASINAIEYAEGPAKGLRPRAEVFLSHEKLEIRVIDYTPGFELPGHVAPPSPLDERGRGLFLIQSVMDDVVYVRGRHENALIMRKWWSTDGAEAGEHKESKSNPLAGNHGEEYPLDDRDPLQDQANNVDELEGSNHDLVRKFCWERLGNISSN